MTKFSLDGDVDPYDEGLNTPSKGYNPVSPYYDKVFNYENMNVGEELAQQYTELVQLRKEVNGREDSKASEIAQVNTACVRVLSEIEKLRNRMHDAEMVKALENAVIECMQEAPEDIKAKFFAMMQAHYEKNKLS